MKFLPSIFLVLSSLAYGQDVCPEIDMLAKGQSMENIHTVEQVGGTCFANTTSQIIQGVDNISKKFPDMLVMKLIMATNPDEDQSLWLHPDQNWDYFNNPSNLEAARLDNFLIEVSKQPVCYKSEDSLTITWLHQLGKTEEEKMRGLQTIYKIYLEYSSDKYPHILAFKKAINAALPNHTLSIKQLMRLHDYMKDLYPLQKINSHRFFTDFFIKGCDFLELPFSPEAIEEREYYSPHDNRDWITTYMDVKKPNPLALTICDYGMREGKSVINFRKYQMGNAFCLDHSVLLIGSKRIDDKCYFKIRDSRYCNQIPYPGIRCQASSNQPFDYLVEANQLLENTWRIRYISELTF